jgi:hypothetical protein
MIIKRMSLCISGMGTKPRNYIRDGHCVAFSCSVRTTNCSSSVLMDIVWFLMGDEAALDARCLCRVSLAPLEDWLNNQCWSVRCVLFP